MGRPDASIARDIRSLRTTADDGSFWPTKLSMASTQQPPVLREVLRGARQTARDDDGRLVVGAELLEHEAAGEVADVLAAQRRHVIVVEHDQVQPSVEDLLVDRDVRLDGQRVRPEVQRLARPRVRDVDHAEGLNLLRLSVFEHLEIFLLQPADEIAVPVDDTHVLFDVVHLHLEGDFRAWAGMVCAAARAERMLAGRAG